MTATSEPDRQVQTAVLHGHGRIGWPQLHTALAAAQATAWADYDGFHIDAPPPDAPPYTHLWSWHADWLLRARIDNDHAIVGVLQLGPTTPPLPNPTTSWTVRYTIRESRTWPHDEKRVGQLPPGVTDQTVLLYEIPGQHPVTLVRLR